MPIGSGKKGNTYDDKQDSHQGGQMHEKIQQRTHSRVVCWWCCLRPDQFLKGGRKIVKNWAREEKEVAQGVAGGR